MPGPVRHAVGTQTQTLQAACLNIAADPVSMAVKMKSPRDTLACLLASIAAVIPRWLRLLRPQSTTKAGWVLGLFDLVHLSLQHGVLLARTRRRWAAFLADLNKVTPGDQAQAQTHQKMEVNIKFNVSRITRKSSSGSYMTLPTGANAKYLYFKSRTNPEPQIFQIPRSPTQSHAVPRTRTLP